MEHVFLLSIGLLFLVTSVAYIAVNQRRRDVVLSRLHFQRRRASYASTPPRSLSPEKKSEKATSVADDVNYKDVFPPSRRCALKEVGFVPAAASAVPAADITASPLESRTSCVPLTKPFGSLEPDTFTCTEFSVEEINALGDFPDYAALSGVPLPKPYHEFRIETAKPRPYRPFRWAYHQTMSLTKMEPDWWLELEDTYADRIKQRRELYAKYGTGVMSALPGSELACKELMEMSLQFLCARYPHYFRLDKENMIFYNGILNTESHLRSTPPLEVLLDNVPEDYAIMLRDPDTGFYHFRAGVICSALGWNVETKLGKRLHEIHEPIPDYKEKMQFSMDRYFAKKPCEKPIQRGSWGLEVDQPLYMPPGDPHEIHRETQNPELTLARCHLRVDWQTLRRIPLSGAIVFNYKALFTAVEQFGQEPYVPGLILHVVTHGKESIMKYKNTWHTEHVVLPALREMHAEQVRKGWVEEGWEPHTLAESPFFPGWEALWHKAQGF